MCVNVVVLMNEIYLISNIFVFEIINNLFHIGLGCIKLVDMLYLTYIERESK